MTESNNYPARPVPMHHGQHLQGCLACYSFDDRAERQRRADNDGRPDRVAELAADIEAAAQRAYWSLTVAQAERIAGLSRGIGVALSGDHRPGRHPWGRANRAAAR